MLIHNRIASSAVNGPGNRAVVWVQGCTLNCRGCWNPETHLFNSSKSMSLSELVDWVVGLDGIQGVTFSGGEPMQQAPWLFVLMTEIRRFRPELSFGMYTGYSQKELEDGRYRWRSEVDGEWNKGTLEIWQQIKGMLDFAIMGRFNQQQATSDKPLCGSKNQEVVFFTDRYSAKDLEQQKVEFTIEDGGLVQITGFPVNIDIDKLGGDLQDGDAGALATA